MAILLGCLFYLTPLELGARRRRWGVLLCMTDMKIFNFSDEYSLETLTFVIVFNIKIVLHYPNAPTRALLGSLETWS